MALDAKGIKFMQGMVDFRSLHGKSENEINEWATKKWDEFKSSEYWDSPDAIPFTSIFIRYMGGRVPDLSSATRQAMQVSGIVSQD